jgi:hypothetical protein
MIQRSIRLGAPVEYKVDHHIHDTCILMAYSSFAGIIQPDDRLAGESFTQLAHGAGPALIIHR